MASLLLLVAPDSSGHYNATLSLLSVSGELQARDNELHKYYRKCTLHSGFSSSCWDFNHILKLIFFLLMLPTGNAMNWVHTNMLATNERFCSVERRSHTFSRITE
eukprot:scaffold1525_cov142-Cylindrotheca_fusiformis.AAC.11